MSSTKLLIKLFYKTNKTSYLVSKTCDILLFVLNNSFGKTQNKANFYHQTLSRHLNLMLKLLVQAWTTSEKNLPIKLNCVVACQSLSTSNYKKMT